jgi:polysaccharide export outer membrane protein
MMEVGRFLKSYVGVMIFGAAACSSLWAQNRLSSDFQRGDGVRVAVWRDPSREGINIQGLGISASYTIDSRGNIQMPLIGEVKVVGSTPEGLATVIREKYAVYISDMIVICYPLIRISVLGSVQKPGSYFVEKRTSLWELIELAGGLDGDANIKKIKVERSGKTVAKDLMSGYEKATSLDELKVQSGDQVLVPGRGKITLRTISEITRFALSVATFIIVRSK